MACLPHYAQHKDDVRINILCRIEIIRLTEIEKIKSSNCLPLLLLVTVSSHCCVLNHLNHYINSFFLSVV